MSNGRAAEDGENMEPEIIDAEIVDSDNLPAVIEASTRSSMNNDAAAVPRWSEEFWRRASPNVQARRCVGHKRNGERCLKAAIKGATVCRTHGGATKHVKRAARIRLENAQDLMAQQLLGVALTAESEAVKLAAIKDVLDRGGLRPPAEVVLSQGEPKPWEQLYEGIAEGSRAESRRARGVPDTESAEGVSNDSLAGLDINGMSSGTSPSRHPAETQLNGVNAGAEEGVTPSESARHEYEQPPSQPAPPQPSRPRSDDRDRQPQAPVHHVTGEAAMRLANEANRAIGAFPEPRAIESPHKRYPRP